MSGLGIIESEEVVIKAGPLGMGYRLLEDIKVRADVSGDGSYFIHDQEDTGIEGVGDDRREAILCYREAIVRFVEIFDKEQGKESGIGEVDNWEATREKFDGIVQRPRLWSGGVEFYEGTGDGRN